MCSCHRNEKQNSNNLIIGKKCVKTDSGKPVDTILSKNWRDFPKIRIVQIILHENYKMTSVCKTSIEKLRISRLLKNWDKWIPIGVWLISA